MEEEERIMAYLEGSLTGTERAAFEAELEGNPDLEERVRLHRFLDGFNEDPTEWRMENELAALLAEEEEEAREEVEFTEEEAPSRRISPRVYLLVAASVLLLAVVGLLLFRSGPAPTPAELYAAHYVPYDASKELRTDAEIPKDLLEPAFDQYRSGNYSEAEAAFAAILNSYPGHPRATFYLGICQMETRQFASAQASFQWVLDDGKNLYLTQAKWYLGLSCLGIEDLGCVRQSLRSLVESQNAYTVQANTILEGISD